MNVFKIFQKLFQKLQEHGLFPRKAIDNSCVLKDKDLIKNIKERNINNEYEEK